MLPTVAFRNTVLVSHGGTWSPKSGILPVPMAFISREPTGPDKFLPWKAATLVAGIVLILVANRWGIGWLIWVAIGVLMVGFVLRFMPQSTHGPDSNDSDSDT